MRHTRLANNLPVWEQTALALVRAVLAFMGCVFLCAQPAQPGETELKCAFLYNFTKFVEWPKDAFPAPDAPLVIGVLGDEHIIKTLRQLLIGKKAHGRSFEVRRVVNPQDAKACQMLFCRNTDTRVTRHVIDFTRGLPVLTIGESSDFLQMNGMLNFTFDEKQLRFEANLPPVEAAGLTLSSQLLRLAKSVRRTSLK